jgi:hypothetical protein
MRPSIVSIFLSLGLGPLAIAAPIPPADQQVITPARSSDQIILRVGGSRDDASRTIDGGDAYDAPWVEIDNRPLSPSSTLSPDEALRTPRPLETSYLLALHKHHRTQKNPGNSDDAGSAEDLVRADGVPETVSPTSYARIEAGRADLYPKRMRLPCWRHRAALDEPNPSETRHDMIIIGGVFSLVFVAFILELLGMLYQWYVEIAAPRPSRYLLAVTLDPKTRAERFKHGEANDIF